MIRLQTFKERFLNEIHLAIEVREVPELLSSIHVISWYANEQFKYTALMTDGMTKLTEEHIDEKFLKIVKAQMVAPTAKTRFGKWLVKLICKIA